MPTATRRAVLLEAGYSCSNPTCHVPLLHAHHIDYVQNGGGNGEDNLIALCPNCHAMVHNKTIPVYAVRTWKTMLIAANHAWTKETLNNLLFLDTDLAESLYLTGDGVVRFSDLIVSGLAEAEHVSWVGDASCVFTVELSCPTAFPASEMTKSAYKMKLTARGKALVQAWKKGDLKNLQNAILQEKETTEEGS
ncbi:MAG: HNH endonuclease signature motif containing protein [Desulfotomaculaceae bacterium]|nr:HNH endonuclease signature motif containing protein [Desulfotomaculaceae bacterium]